MPSDTTPILFRHTLRVYWEDTDAGGVVFYANYLKFFERGRTEWLRSLGFEQERLRLESEAMFVVTETAVRFLSPARLDDLIEVTVQIVHCGRVAMSLQQQARRGDTLLAEGTIAIACVHAGTFKPCRIPNELLQALQ